MAVGEDQVVVRVTVRNKLGNRLCPLEVVSFDHLRRRDPECPGHQVSVGEAGSATGEAESFTFHLLLMCVASTTTVGDEMP